MTRSERIEEAARALIIARDLPSLSGKWTDFWNALDALRAALASPADAPRDESGRHHFTPLYGTEGGLCTVCGLPHVPAIGAPAERDTPVTRPWSEASPDFKDGYRAGWHDREGDLLCAVERIAPPADAHAGTDCACGRNVANGRDHRPDVCSPANVAHAGTDATRDNPWLRGLPRGGEACERCGGTGYTGRIKEGTWRNCPACGGTGRGK